jgi:hypothetical protein
MPFSRAELIGHFRTVNARDPTPDEMARLEAAVPTTVEVSQGSTAGRGYDHQAGLARVYRDALAAGLPEEGARAAVAIAQTEGGMGGAQGDAAIGGSRGTFQLYFGGGQGDNFAAAQGLSKAEADRRLAADPHAANLWALGGYLGQAIRRGLQMGLSGPDLATFAQKTGQVSVSPERAGQNYAKLFATGTPPEIAAAVPAERQRFLEANSPGESGTATSTSGLGATPRAGVRDLETPEQPADVPPMGTTTTQQQQGTTLGIDPADAFAQQLLRQLGAVAGTGTPGLYRLPGRDLPGWRPSRFSLPPLGG